MCPARLAFGKLVVLLAVACCRPSVTVASSVELSESCCSCRAAVQLYNRSKADVLHVQVGDFGLARLAIEGDGSSIATATRGTVSHQPPELLAEGRLTAAADVHAFGVLLWCAGGRGSKDGLWARVSEMHVYLQCNLFSGAGASALDTESFF